MLKSVNLAVVLSLVSTAGVWAQGAQEQPATVSPELTQRLSQLLSQDWEGNPEWAKMASEILAGRDTMGMGKGWFKAPASRHDWKWLRSTFDKNPRDGEIERQELPKSTTDVQFSRLDRDQDGAVTSRDLLWANNHMMEGYSPSNDVFSRLDKDSNGRLTKEEMNSFFDRYSDGFDFLTPDDVKKALRFKPAPPPNLDQIRRQSRMTVPQRWQLMELLLRGGLGNMEPGPELEDDAPNFRLPLLTRDKENHELKLSSKRVQLSDSKGKRPVVLIFGSFT